MKYIWVVTCGLFLSVNAYAGPTGATNSSVQGQESRSIVQDHTSEGYQESSHQEEPSEELESDSSYYSVNKFNFLFYLVYKIKYTDDGIPVEEENAVMIEE